MDQNTKLLDKLRVMLAITRECLQLKEEADALSDPEFDDFWNSMECIEGDLTTLKSECLI